MSFPTDPFFPSLPGVVGLDAPVEVPKGYATLLKSLGHKMERFVAAWEIVRRRLEDTESVASLRKWAKSPFNPVENLDGEGTFVTALWADFQGFPQVTRLFLPEAMALRCLELWRQVDPEAPKVLSPLIAVPEGVDAPVWLALLRLRPLRTAWESALRRDHLETLLQVLPEAWLLDPTPLPHGSVIPRLELATWEDLPKFRGERAFAITRGESASGSRLLGSLDSPEKWRDEVRSALAGHEAQPSVLLQVPEKNGRWLAAVYEKKGGRVDYRGVVALQQSGDGQWKASRVR